MKQRRKIEDQLFLIDAKHLGKQTTYEELMKDEEGVEAELF